MINEFIVRFAQHRDLSSWMDMVRIVRYNFPLLETEDELESYKNIVIKNINRNTALCVSDEDLIVGVLIFSYNQKCLSCMAVHPDYRRKGIASIMIEKMLSLFPENEDIWVDTFREDDEKGIAPRDLYKSFGFIEDELIIVNDYPHQRFILHRKEGQLI